MAAKKRLTLDKIRAVDDLGSEDFDVEEWDGTIKIRGLSREEVGELSSEFKVDDPTDLDFVTVQGVEEWLLARGVIDPEITEDDVAVFKSKGMKPVQRISRRIQELSGLLDPPTLERDVEWAVEELSTLSGEEMSVKAAETIAAVAEKLAQSTEQRVEAAARKAFPSD